MHSACSRQRAVGGKRSPVCRTTPLRLPLLAIFALFLLIPAGLWGTVARAATNLRILGADYRLRPAAGCGLPSARRLLPAAYLQQGPFPSAAPGSEAPPEHYTLTPDQRARAEAYSQAQDTAYFAGVALALATYL
ncbi:MAG TPA: hypothetical protein VI455_18100, partial [Terriglobia bacterium]